MKSGGIKGKKSKSKKNKGTNKAKADKKTQPTDMEAASGTDDLLESVSDSMEMAGKAMDFFEDEVVEGAPRDGSLDPGEMLGDTEVLEAAGDEEVLEPVADLEPLPSEDVEEGQPEDEALAVASENPVMEDEDQQEMLEDDSVAEGDFIDEAQFQSILESVLFASDRPVGIGIFKMVFKGTNIKPKDIKKGLEELQGAYADGRRGVTLEEIGNGWQLRTKMDNMAFLQKLGKTKPFKLSGPALEVLSILAYKQPLVKSEVDHIRGVESGHLVRALMDRGLVSFQGKSELPGKPMLYGTTRKFLEIFGLRNLKELPSLEEIDQLLPEGIGEDGDDEKLSDVTASMSEEVGERYSEGEEELEKITEKLGDIDVSSDFFEQEKIRQREKRELEKARDIREAVDLGEDVEAKDVRWLERYDHKMAEKALEAETAAGLAKPASEESVEEEGPALSEELTALSEESADMELSAEKADGHESESYNPENPGALVEASEPQGDSEGDRAPLGEEPHLVEVDPFEDMDLS